MIFQTIQGEATGAVKSIGLFGLKFNELKETINKVRNNGIIRTLVNIPSINTNTIEEYNNSIANGYKPQEAFASATKNANQATIDLIKSANGGAVSIDALTAAQKASTLASKTQSLMLNGVAIAGNMITNMGIAFAASKAISFIYEMVTANEKLLTNAKELTSEFKNSEASIHGYKIKISELHTIINDESASINDITQARKDLMLVQNELINKFGSEKNSIDIITDSINNQGIALDGLAAKQYKKWKNKFNEKSTYEKIIDSTTVGNQVFYIDSKGNLLDDSHFSKMIYEMEHGYYRLKKSGNEVLDSLIKETYGLEDAMFGTSFAIKGNQSEIENIVLGIQNLTSGFDVGSSFSMSLTDIANKNTKVLDAYKDAYQSYILYEKILNNSPDNNYDDMFGAITKAKQDYDNAVISGDTTKISNASEHFSKTTSDAMATALKNSDENVADYFSNMYPELSKMVAEWQFDINFRTNTDQLSSAISSSLKKLKGLSSEEINTLDPATASREQVEGWTDLNAIAEANDLSFSQLLTLLEKLNLVQSSSYQQLTNKFGQENVSKLTSEELVVAYELSNDSVKNWDDLVTKVRDKINAITDDSKGIDIDFPVTSTITQLEQLSPAFDTLKSAYQDIFRLENGQVTYDPGNIDLSKITALKSNLESLSKDYNLDIDFARFEEYAKVLSDTTSESDEMRDAFNGISSTILGSLNPVLSDCTEENVKVIESFLKSIGITNAQEIASEALAGRYIDEAKAMEILADSSLTLESATQEEIAALEQQGAITPEVAARLYEFMYAKQAANTQNMDTSGEIANLLALAENAGYTGEVIRYLTELEQIYQEVSSGTLSWPIKSLKLARAGMLQGLIKSAASNISFAPKVALNPNVSNGKAKQSAASAGKQTADAYVEAFDAELKQLDDLKSTGKITEKQYLDALRRLYVKYYGQKKQYLDQYEKYENQYLSGMKSLYESAFSYITKQIDKRISDVESQRDAEIKGLEAQKQAAEDAYQAQIDAVDEQIKGIEKQIDKKNEEIDAINEAAEARKRELDLQKAQYDLERMQNQKTNYVMTDNGFQYQADTTGIRDAGESLDDAKREIEIGKIEETINGLEQQKVILEEQRAALESALEASNAYWESQIENTNMYYDTLVSNLEAYKGRWEELASMEETAKMQATLAELGIAEQDILNMNEEAFQRVKDNYLGILADMYNGNALMQEQLSALSGYNFSGITGYLDSTKSALDTLDSMTLQGIGGEVEGLVTSSSDASAAIGGIQGNTEAAMQSIQPLNTEFDTLKTLLDEITLLFSTLVFPELGDENYVQKLQEIAAGFEQISEKSKLLAQIDFTKIIGSAGGSGAPADGSATGGSTGSPSTGANPGGVVPGGGGTGFLGFSSAVSEAVKSITLQMALLGMAMTLGNLAFLGQITMINEQYIPAWENLQSRLAEIIGVGGGKNDKSKTSPSKKSAKKTAEGDKTTAGNSGSIIDTLQLGGEMVSDKLKDPWLRSFNEFATGGNSVESICDKIKQLVEEMAREIEHQCASAAQALSDLANQYFSNPALGGKGAVQLALGNAGSAISGILPRSASTYMPLEESNPEKYEMLMRFSDQPAPIEASPFVMSDFNNEMKDAIKNVSNTANLSTVSKSININIGDIRVEGVTDAGGLAEAIKERLPNMLLQEMKK